MIISPIFKKVSPHTPLNINPKHYKKFFTAHSIITCIHSEFLLNGALAQCGLFLTYKKGVFDIFINKNKEALCLKDGLDLFTNDNRYKKFIREFKAYISIAKKTFIPRYQTIPSRLTKDEFIEAISFLGKFWHYFGYTEFPYTDLAYKEMKKRKDAAMEKRLDELSQFKFIAREVLNVYFFEGGVINNLLAFISRNFFTADDAKYLYFDEIVCLFDGSMIDRRIIEERKISYSAALIRGNIITFSYPTSLKLNSLFTRVEDTAIIQGIIANPGFARGKAIISPMLDNHKAIALINKRMNKGDILVAETTSPDVLMLCRKASAIVADQGGMLSHAAVISRELHIPCIVQTGNAVRIFKDGDYIEVDAYNGTVRKVGGKDYR